MSEENHSERLCIIGVVKVSYVQLQSYLEMCAKRQSDIDNDDVFNVDRYSTDPTMSQAQWDKQTVINKFPDWGAAYHGPDLEGLTDEEWAMLGLEPGGGSEGDIDA